MAIESIRRSGYRMVGGIYLCADFIHRFKTPSPIPICPSCGQGPNLSRNITEIKTSDYKGNFLMLVGKHFYPTTESFLEEAEKLGVSKRVPFVAKNIVLDKSVIMLAHPTCLKGGWGMFAFFIPTRIEMLVWARDYNKTYKPTYTIVRVPDGDLNHSPWKRKHLI